MIRLRRWRKPVEVRDSGGHVRVVDPVNERIVHENGIDVVYVDHPLGLDPS